ncbi:MAG: hypothetical protein IJC63_04285 [Myxococcaceae bacterium]|nr:hypothetical protein [Myxococcaceae bacterium]
MRRSLLPIAPFAFALLALLALFCVEVAAGMALSCPCRARPRRRAASRYSKSIEARLAP